MADLTFIVPTITDHPSYQRYRELQVASLKGKYPILYADEQNDIVYESVLDKIIKAWRHVWTEGRSRFIGIMHHDVVIDNLQPVDEMLDYMIRDDRLAAIGAPDGDDFARNNRTGRDHLSIYFSIWDTEKLADWTTEEETHDGILNWEDYWLLSIHARNRGYDVLQLDVDWAKPKLGVASSVLWRGKTVATHAWFSSWRLRQKRFSGSMEGHTTEELEEWEHAFFARYGRRHQLNPDWLRRVGCLPRREAGRLFGDAYRGATLADSEAGVASAPR